MASPQLENGYTPIANEILEKIASAQLSGRDMSVVMVILRKTYGYKKKKDKISHGQLAEATKLSVRTCIRSVQDLEVKKIIIVERETEGSVKLPNTLSFNKNYDEWVVSNISEQTEENRKQTRKRIAKMRKEGSVKHPEKGSDKHKKVVTNNEGGSDKQRHLVVSNNAKKVRCLSHTKEKRNKDNTKERRENAPPTPKENAEKFFNGVLDLIAGKEVVWLQEFLRTLASQNNVPKRQIWDEIRNFCSWWTEKNGTGTRERWQLQKTFEVDRRLLTWFRHAGMSNFTTARGKGKEIIGLTD